MRHDTNLTEGYGECPECVTYAKELTSLKQRVLQLEKVREAGKVFMQNVTILSELEGTKYCLSIYVVEGYDEYIQALKDSEVKNV